MSAADRLKNSGGIILVIVIAVPVITGFLKSGIAPGAVNFQDCRKLTVKPIALIVRKNTLVSDVGGLVLRLENKPFMGQFAMLVQHISDKQNHVKVVAGYREY